MHVEPGYVAPAKVALANVGALGVVMWACAKHIKNFAVDPFLIVKSLMAASVFSLFMQSFHVPVGPSELHFVGAMAIYLTLGFTPTLLGFGIGLALQGAVFEPADLLHLGVNSLSLMLPLISVHAISGHRVFNRDSGDKISWTQIVKLDAMYYAGVTSMVGFWLMISDVTTPVSAWATFALSYLIVVLCEPIITYAAVKVLKAFEGHTLVSRLTAVHSLSLRESV